MKPDKIIEERVLYTAEQIAASARVAGRHRCITENGRKHLLVQTDARIFVDTSGQDLSAYNVLVVHLKPVRLCDAALVTRLHCASRHPGMAVNDIYSSVLHFNQPGPWRGWQRLLIPAVNLIATGFPDGWSAVEAIELDLHAREQQGEIVVGAIELQRVEMPQGPRMSDGELLEALDMDHPALRAVAGHAAAGRTAQAITALARAVRKLRQPPLGEVALKERPAADEVERIHRNRIQGEQLPEKIDWHCNPAGYLEWNHAFNRHGWMTLLAAAFRDTGRVRHARKLDSLMRSWIEQNPEPIGHNGGLDPAWETLSTSLRINRSWPHILDIARRSRTFRDRTLVDMIKMIHGHAEHLLNYWGHCNWYVSESAALVAAASMAPFVVRSKHWMKTGIDRLEDSIQSQVFPDGAQYELSPNYHSMCAELFHSARRRAEFRDHRFSKSYTERLTAMFDYLVGIVRPDASFPVPNDAGVALKRNNVPLLEAGRTERRSDWVWAGSGGAEGREPESPGSVHYPDAGHAIMRSGWHVDDRWAFIDVGPLGAAHQHEDKLQVELYAYGTPFLVDPGISSYQSDPVVSYFRTGSAHNTVNIDGRSQWRRRSGDRRSFQASNRGKAFWAAGRGLDFAQGTYNDAYGDLANRISSTASGGHAGVPVTTGITHTRSLVFVRPDYWLILDSIAGSGIHAADALWHFIPMHVRVDAETATIRTQRINRPNLELICRGDWERAAVEIVTGREDPVQGFIALDGEVKPAPCAVVSRRKRLPLHGVTVAIPFASGSESHVRATTRTVRRGKSYGLLIDVRHATGARDRFIWRHSGRAALEADGIRSDGTLAAVRYAPDGAVRYAGLVDGRSLQCGEAVLKGKRGELVEK